MALDPIEFYKNCNLKSNPFRSNPTHESDPRMNIWVGYDREKETLLKFLIRSRADQVGNANFIMVYGEFGTGKSHALLWSKHQILNAKKEDFDSVAYYIPTLKKDAGKLSFASAFRDDIVNRSNLVTEIQRLSQFLDTCVIEARRSNSWSVDVTKETVLEKLIPAVELFNFAKEVVRVESEADARSLLLPSKLGDYLAMTTFTAIINLFVYEIKIGDKSYRYKKGAYLFIDELDLLATCAAKEARETNELLRHIYDNCPNCFCMVLGFTASSAELNVLFADYVMSRVQRQINMELMTVDDATNFVGAILDSDRIDENGKKGSFPFEDNAIELVVSQIVSITPRRLINGMQQILEEVRLAGLDPANDRVSTEFLEDNGLIDEVLGGL